MYWPDLVPIVMFMTLAALLFTGYPVAHVLGGVGLAFGAFGYALGLFAPIEFFNLIGRIWGGLAENLVLVALPMYVFMGAMLEKSGVAQDLLHALNLLLRRTPGGLALAVTAVGTIFAAATGIIGASVVMLAVLALPTMLRRGYDPAFATGTIAAAGVLGILIPPSVMLVILSDQFQVSTGSLFLGAMLPGLLLAALYGVYVIVAAALRPALAPPLPPEERAASLGAFVRFILKSFVPPVVLIVLVLGSIIVGWATPTEASAVGAGGAVLLAIANRRLTWSVLDEVCVRTALISTMVFGIYIGATGFSYVFRSLGGDFVVVDLVDSLGLASWSLLVLLMGIIFLLGFFFDWIEISLIVLPIFLPILRLIDLGGHVESEHVILWFAILMAVNLQTSFLTPPFGPALFFIKGAAGDTVTVPQLYRGVVPFVILQLGGLAICIAFPAIVLWLPNLAFGR